MSNSSKKRCSWSEGDPLYQEYHDTIWGRPVHDEKTLFEFLVLEGAQAGLSWITILKRRDSYALAYDGFDPQIVSGYGEEKISHLLQNPGIIRNKLKILSSVKNAQVFLAIQKEYGSFDKFIWSFVNHTPILNHFKDVSLIPSQTPLSESISKDLKKRGMTFVGPTIIYAFMQAIGMVNDHTQGCFLFKE